MFRGRDQMRLADALVMVRCGAKQIALIETPTIDHEMNCTRTD